MKAQDLPHLENQKTFRPTQLFRRWRGAAGSDFSWLLPAAAFSSLAIFSTPAAQPLFYDEACRELAENFLQTLEGEAVRSGEAILIIDLPGAISAGLGFYLQGAGINPVLLFGGLWRPGAVLDGSEAAEAVLQYGSRLKPEQIGRGYAFLLERERAQEIPPLKLAETFDNRYRAYGLLPTLPDLRKIGVSALIDLRRAGDDMPDDTATYYEKASKAGFDIFQLTLNA